MNPLVRKPSSCGRLGGFFGLVLLTHGAAAQQQVIEIEPVVVTASRTATSTLGVPAGISVITREQIEASGASKMTDVLRGHGGVQITDITGDGGNTTVSVRGFSQTANANVLIMIDGRRLNYADTRAPDLGHIALQDVERVEILQGSAGVLFGDQAVGGVVNIITRKSTERRANVSLELGSYDRGAARVSLSDTLDNGFSYRVSAEHVETDNYRDNNTQQFDNVSAYVSYALPEGEVYLDLQRTEDMREQPGSLLAAEVAADRRQSNAAFVNDFSDITNDVRRLGLILTLNDNWAFEGEYTLRELDQTLTQSFRGFPSPAGGHAGRDQRSINPRLIGSIPMAAGELQITAGLDWDQGNIALFIPNAFGAVSRSTDQRVKSAYFQATYPLRTDLDVTVGVRNSKMDSHLVDATAFPAGRDVSDSIFVNEIGMAYRLNDRWRLYARRDENFRFAKIDELTNSGGVILNSQEGYSLESGAEWRDGERFLSANLYRLELTNEIAFDPTVGLFGQNVNLDATRRNGLTIAGGLPFPLWDALYLSADLSLVDARFSSGAFDGKNISGVADAMLTLRAQWRVNKQWRLMTELLAIDDKPAQGDNANTQAEAAGYGVTNLTVSYERGPWTARLRVNNLTDKQYSEQLANSGFGAGFQPSPERNAVLNIAYAF